MQGIDPEMLPGKVVWVTASARGLGRTLAERLARCEAVIHRRSDQTAAEFGEAPSTHHVAADISQLGAPGRRGTAIASACAQAGARGDDESVCS